MKVRKVNLSSAIGEALPYYTNIIVCRAEEVGHDFCGIYVLHTIYRQTTIFADSADGEGAYGKCTLIRNCDQPPLVYRARPSSVLVHNTSTEEGLAQ